MSVLPHYSRSKNLNKTWPCLFGWSLSRMAGMPTVCQVLNPSMHTPYRTDQPAIQKAAKVHGNHLMNPKPGPRCYYGLRKSTCSNWHQLVVYSMLVNSPGPTGAGTCPSTCALSMCFFLAMWHASRRIRSLCDRRRGLSHALELASQLTDLRAMRLQMSQGESNCIPPVVEGPLDHCELAMMYLESMHS